MGETRQYSELMAVDFGLGAYIAAAFEGIPPHGPSEFQNFLVRDVDKKIYRAYESDPIRLLARYLKTQHKINVSSLAYDKHRIPIIMPQDGTDADSSAVISALPIVFYGRKPGVQSDTEKNYHRDIHVAVNLSDEAMAPLDYNIGIFPVMLEYTFVMYAWDRATLDKMQLAWMMHTAKTTKFQLQYKIDDVPEFTTEPLKGTIVDAKSIAFEDISADYDTRRLYGVSHSLSVKADVIAGAGVTVVDPIRYIVTLNAME